jgi:arabinan endo-1,5-alpha-L-arabinosidase
MEGVKVKRFSAVLLTLALVVAATAVAVTGASAQTIIDPDGFYQVVSRHSGKAIQASAGAGDAVVQWEPSEALNQQFQLVPASGGTYRLRARSTGQVLDVWEWNPDNGADIRMWTDLDGANQRFQVIEQTDGYVRFINQFSGRALDVWGWSTQDGGRISQYTDHGGANQQWLLMPVDGEPSPSPDPTPSPTPVPTECQGGGGGVVDPMPVSGNVASHDPSMIRTPSGYVLFSTHNGVQTRTSPDRSQFTRRSAAIPGGATWAGAYNNNDPNAIWAPDISFHNGTYWLYYSVSTFGSNRSAIGLATSSTGQPVASPTRVWCTTPSPATTTTRSTRRCWSPRTGSGGCRSDRSGPASR